MGQRIWVQETVPLLGGGEYQATEEKTVSIKKKRVEGGAPRGRGILVGNGSMEQKKKQRGEGGGLNMSVSRESSEGIREKG